VLGGGSLTIKKEDQPMTNFRFAFIVIILLLGLGSVAWLGRYEITQLSSNDLAYRLDRWTGRVELLSGPYIKFKDLQLRVKD
jgi:hypothetical protein